LRGERPVRGGEKPQKKRQWRSGQIVTEGEKVSSGGRGAKAQSIGGRDPISLSALAPSKSRQWLGKNSGGARYIVPGKQRCQKSYKLGHPSAARAHKKTGLGCRQKRHADDE